jgi:hypothetical protein
MYKEEWIPPSKPGLSNSDRIIPEYYQKKYNLLITELCKKQYV